MTRFAICVIALQIASLMATDDAECLATDDAECLLQVSTQVDQKAKLESQPKDVCECLSWSRVYSMGWAECQNGNEAFFLKHREINVSNTMEYTLSQMKATEFCHQFYDHLDDNICVNKNQGEDFGQWCYVNPDCPAEKAKGMRTGLGNFVSHRDCDLQKDMSLRHKTVRQLVNISHRTHIDIGVMHKMAYPLNSRLFGSVQAFWGINGTAADLAPNVAKEMQAIVDLGQPVSFDTNSKQKVPHRIVVGRTVFGVENDDVDLFDGSMMDASRWHKLVCIKGCDLPTAQ